MESLSNREEIAPDAGVTSQKGHAQPPSFVAQVDLNQVYVLIDNILPFEACLYYQVLPLFIEGSRLMIGTVYPDDPGAIAYVQKQLSYINYSIVFKTISSDWHRDLLSKYLSHTAKQRQSLSPISVPESLATDAPGLSTLEQAKAQGCKRSHRSTLLDQNQQKTFIVDQPEDILGDELTVIEVPGVQPARHLSPEVTLSPAVLTEPAATELCDAADVDIAPLHLHIDERYRDVADGDLVTLPPRALMQALLSKVLKEGIGRLYFERQSRAGRILWSRDGILQAVVDSIDAQLFQGVINEFKRLTHLSLISVQKPKQVEIERLLNHQRILLRFRVMPNAFGEEATLQVLRGTALRFYQQQQIEKLGRDALDAAQILQYRLNEIRDRARSSLNFQPTRSETLPAIVELLKQMEAQVEEIVAAYDLSERMSTIEARNPLGSEKLG